MIGFVVAYSVVEVRSVLTTSKVLLGPRVHLVMFTGFGAALQPSSDLDQPVPRVLSLEKKKSQRGLKITKAQPLL